ncbi:MAG: bifunctional nicotinamidase/pyrazinamidase [Bacteroidota bacterium]
MKTLLTIDMQNDFLPGGALAVPEGDDVISVINNLQEKFDLVIATQDWHPERHGSFASVHEGKKPMDKTELNGLEQVLWPDHCVQGTKGAEYTDKLNTKRIEAIFRKGMEHGIDSYSGFYDNGHKKSTGLADYLRGRNVGELYVVGLAGDVCVNYTILDAVKEGFKTYLNIDGTKPVNKDGFEAVVENMKQKGASIIQSGDV